MPPPEKQKTMRPPPVPFFRPKAPVPVPSSSAYPSSDPFEPLPQSSRAATPAPRILAVEIPANVLRPVAFRIFTKKHNLTLKSEALTLLCSFIGRRCGADWKDTGSGEKLLDEVARQWKRNEGAAGILVDGGEALKGILRGLEVGDPRAKKVELTIGAGIPSSSAILGGESSGGIWQQEEEGDEEDQDRRKWLKVVDAWELPKLNFNPGRKMFEKAPKASLLPNAHTKTNLFRNRYHLLQHRILRHESFLPPTFTSGATTKSYHKLTPISNLLGRANQSFLLFGMLSISPSGSLSLLDPTGDITLDISQAVPAHSAYFCPGCFVIVDGIFTEDGRFFVLTVGQPPPERRNGSAEVFGHVDFLGNGISLDMGSTGGGMQGHTLRKRERADSARFLFLGEAPLDEKSTLKGLKKIFDTYVSEDDLGQELPLVVVLTGNFTSTPVSPTSSAGSVRYKECFDSLATLLTEYPQLVEHATFVFVPGDNDPWASTFSGGAASTLPRGGVPEVFTSRVRRVVRGAKWGSNPCWLGYWTARIVVLRDDLSARLGRCELRFEGVAEDMEVDEGAGAGPGDEERVEGEKEKEKEGGAGDAGRGDEEVDEEMGRVRKLVKTIMDQGYLSPFPLPMRPVLWDYAHALSLYPLPNALVLSDPNLQPFTVTYEGCHVMNPGKMVERRKARWIEYEPARGRGVVRECEI
ncbi:DNA-directed DNA polymerase epsilon, subunit B [Rhizina undulata]